jgi:hypothetical protein
MEKKLEEISKKALLEIRTFLKNKNLFDKNYTVELIIGRYSINYKREFGKFEDIIDIPDELYYILKKNLIEIDILWKEEGEEQEWEENRGNAEHKIDIIIDGNPYQLRDVSEIEGNVKLLKIKLEACIKKEEFEEASRLRDLIKKYEIKIEDSNKS